MMNKAELQKFFLLENDPHLFETALNPRSCGGNAEFEQLALYGDSVINMHLYDYLISKNWKLKGDITSCKKTIHKESVIKVFAEEVLYLPEIMVPLDSTHRPQDRDLAETMEALIGAAFKVNGLEKCKPIVYSFLDFSIKKQKKLREKNSFDLSQDYKSKLLELFKAEKLEKPEIEPEEEYLPDGSKAYRFIGNISFKDSVYTIHTSPHSKKKKAEQEAAYLALCKIAGEYVEYSNFDPAVNMQPTQEITIKPTSSIDQKELIFRKPDSEEGLAEVSTNNGELLIEWAKRKAKENVFGMFISLSGRLDTVSGASWTCEMSEDVLALINLKLEEKLYFAIGFGPSKTKARKNAGENMLIESDIFRWLEEHYPDKTI